MSGQIFVQDMTFYYFHLFSLRVIYVHAKGNGNTKKTEDKAMTNEEAKKQAFREATARRNAKKAEAARRNPAKAAYEAGKITWAEYLAQASGDEDWMEE